MNADPSREAIVHRLRLACELTDAASLTSLLAPDVAALVDSGGDIPAPTRPLHGTDAVTAALLELCGGASVTEQWVNAAPAVVVRRGVRVVAVVSVEVRESLVRRVWVTRSPQKLQRWNG
ncbi:hypothetical protein M2152_002606 [Microbacteriaceae bacterium SG_E_30_P1]|uniref:SnoaL-like domain-containing protein n=1 Tax=Antiquaquibacter oligotrophicus TaxID=2880260 RepID=A0ABT6KTB0_9MICO|nr:hypothetical protein [Antiquaquibacter oligotrophicus]MDH6182424.1 hypothetical protein [Antiquaquibacter oligotrophicus]UDF14605.1 hypothetical protein LH407_07015 [Antiquaquibacter oligotrophicus]